MREKKPSPFSPEEILSETILFKSKFGDVKPVPEHLVFNMAILSSSSPPIKRYPVLVPGEVVKVKSPEPPKKEVRPKPSKPSKKELSLPFRKPVSFGDPEIDAMREANDALLQGHPKYWKLNPAQRDYEFIKAHLKTAYPPVGFGVLSTKHFRNTQHPTIAEVRKLPARAKQDYTRARELADRKNLTYEHHVELIIENFTPINKKQKDGSWKEIERPHLRAFSPNDEDAFDRWNDGGAMQVLITHKDIEDCADLCPENWVTVSRSEPDWIAETRRLNFLRIKFYEDYLLNELLRYVKAANTCAGLAATSPYRPGPGPGVVTNAIRDGLLALEYVEGYGTLHDRKDLEGYTFPPGTEFRFKRAV